MLSFVETILISSRDLEFTLLLLDTILYMYVLMMNKDYSDS